MPNMQERIHESEDNEATYEDGTRGDARITEMRRMRQEVPHERQTEGTSEDKLRRREKLGKGVKKLLKEGKIGG